MPTSEYTRTITVTHEFVAGQTITDGRHTFYIIRVDAEGEEYVVDDLDDADGRGQGVGITYVDAKFVLKPKQVVYVCYTTVSYEGCSVPISVHNTLEGAQESFGPGRDWKGPSVDREWAADGSFSDYEMIAEMEVKP